MATYGVAIKDATFASSGAVADALRFTWELKSQSTTNNASYVDWKLELVAYQYGAISSSTAKAWTVKVNGTEYSGTSYIGINANSTKLLASGSTTIPHNADGKKTFYYSFSQYFGISFNGSVGTVSGTGAGTLEFIARASQPSLITFPDSTANVGYFGDTISIHMNRASSSFTHRVRYEFGSSSGVCIDAETGKQATAVGTGFRWTVPTSFMNLLPSSTSGSGRIYVDTYNGSELVGTKYTGFTASVPASVKPTVSMVLDDTTGIDDVYGSPVANLSSIKMTANWTTAYGSAIKTIQITAKGKTNSITPIAGATSFAYTIGKLTASDPSYVKVTVTDKRGRSASAEYTMTVQDYSAPAITALAVHRCDADGNEDEDGDYVKATFSATVSSMDKKNTATYTLKYKKSTDSAYTSVSLSDLANNYAPSNYSKVFPADGNSSYDVTIVAKDLHGEGTRSTSASTAFVLYNAHPSGTGWRFGGVAEKENTLQNDLVLNQTANSYCSYTLGTEGVRGFAVVARIEITHTNANAPVTFELTRRNSNSAMTVHVRFKNENSRTPGLDKIRYEGQNYGAFLYQESDSVWLLYVEKSALNDPITVQRWTTSMFMDGRVSVTFPTGLQVDAVPSPYYRATPLIVDSILDSIMPVGFVLTLYSHDDPNDMYPGTTWVRLSGGFLWASQAGDIIGQTGGEKTVTLTVNQIPAHNHGGTYTNAGDSTKTHAWLASGGSAMAYASVDTGGGQAHNNMPPYIQVSIWRRKA